MYDNLLVFVWVDSALKHKLAGSGIAMMATTRRGADSSFTVYGRVANFYISKTMVFSTGDMYRYVAVRSILYPP